LNELNVNEFEILNDFQKEKIAQMFIDETIDISDNNTIKSNLSRYKKALEGHKQPTPLTQNTTDTTTPLTQNTTDTTTPLTQAPGFAGKEVKVKFLPKNKYSVNDGKEVDIKDFDTLGKFVKMVSDNNVSVYGNTKFNFTVSDGNTIHVTLGKVVDFKVKVSDWNFGNLLQYVETLKNLKLVDDTFTFKVVAMHNNNSLRFVAMDVRTGFLTTKSAWTSIKSFNDLFDFGDGIMVSNNNGLGQIGTLNLNFVIFDNQGKVLKEWDKIFIKYVKPKNQHASQKKYGGK
jgi:hypothetical protein